MKAAALNVLCLLAAALLAGCASHHVEQPGPKCYRVRWQAIPFVYTDTLPTVEMWPCM